MSRDQSPQSTTNTQRILLVEDEWIVALDLKMFLTDAGYTVVGPAGRVSDALALLEEEEVDAAVLDVNLSGETSKPIALHLREKRIPFIFLTGYSREQLGPEFSMEIVLNKPLSQMHLRRALDELFATES